MKLKTIESNLKYQKIKNLDWRMQSKKIKKLTKSSNIKLKNQKNKNWYSNMLYYEDYHEILNVTHKFVSGEEREKNRSNNNLSNNTQYAPHVRKEN